MLGQQREVLLMDEPFAALDAITRDVLHEELVGSWAETGVAVGSASAGGCAGPCCRR